MGPLEDHLLICPGCRDRLEATDEYVAAMKSAAAGPGFILYPLLSVNSGIAATSAYVHAKPNESPAHLQGSPPSYRYSP